MAGFGDRLFDAVKAKDSVVVAGIDPHLDRLPGGAPTSLTEAADRVVAFFSRFIELVAPHVVGVKPQAAFFEALGGPGWGAYEALVAHARAHDLIVIADVKRGDIGSTSAAYATAYLAPELLPGAPNPRQADAVTVNAYLGHDGVEPFTRVAAEHGGGLFVLVKTSNPGSADFQDLALAAGGTTAEHMAERVAAWTAPHRGESGYGLVGAVVGATHPDVVASLRPRLAGVPVLLPGYGAQGGTAEALSGWFDDDGLGAVVPASRSLAFGWDDPQAWEPAVVAAARDMQAALNAVR